MGIIFDEPGGSFYFFVIPFELESRNCTVEFFYQIYLLHTIAAPEIE